MRTDAPPRATARLQIHAGFTLDDARAALPYLARLGISHVYASPLLAARPGSNHGYDVTDPTRIDPERGGEEGFARFTEALRDHGLGLILDIVPNHMATGPHTPWWQDVLENGSTTAFGTSSGWLNRTLQAMAPARKVQAMAVGEETPLILQGKVQCSSWAPGSKREIDPLLPQILTDLYADDALLGPALAAGLQTDQMADKVSGGMGMGGKLKTYAGKPSAAKEVAASLGKLMTAPGGPTLCARSR